MRHSLNVLPVSSHLEGLPGAEIASSYLITPAGFLFHELAGLPVNSCEPLASMTGRGKGLLSPVMHCMVSSETSPFV